MSSSINSRVNFSENKSHLLLNPRLGSEETATLISLFETYDRFPNHFWISSSGSAQKPNESKKLYALSREAILASARAANTHLQVGHHDRWLNVLPRFHVGGLGILARAHVSETPVFDDSDSSWSPLEFVQACEQNQITLSSLVPTQVFDLVTMELRAPESLRAIVVGGAVLSTELYRKARLLGWRLLPSFGMTEFCSQIATADLQSLTQTEFPRALKVLNHVKVELNQHGLLKVDGPSKFTGFAQNKDGEKRWTQAPEGMFLTSDRAEILGDYLIPHGRGEEFVKIKGEGVSLPWLREKLLGIHPHGNLTLIAVADSRDGAQLAIAGEDSLAILQTYALRFNREAMPFESVSLVAKVEKLPRTDLGKVRWEELIQMVSEQIARGDAQPL